MKRPVIVTVVSAFLTLGVSTIAKAAPMISDVTPIILHDGVNSIDHLSPDGRAGVIVRVAHSSSPIADGNSINYMVMLPRRGGDGWLAVAAERTPSMVSDVPFGGMLLSAAPHTGEDWKRSINFARGKVNGASSVLMFVGERDMKKAANAYAPVPVEISVFRMTDDTDAADQPHFILIAKQDAERCYVNVQLAVHDVDGLPLPTDYAGPKTSAACN